jgi:hypothetical protein
MGSDGCSDRRERGEGDRAALIARLVAGAGWTIAADVLSVVAVAQFVTFNEKQFCKAETCERVVVDPRAVPVFPMLDRTEDRAECSLASGISFP